VTIAVVFSSLLTVALVGLGTYELARAGAPLDEWTSMVVFEGSEKHVIPALLVAVVLGLSAMPDGTTSRWMRLAVLLPITHAVALVIVLISLPHLDLPALDDHVPFLESLPVMPWFVSGLGLVLALAWAIGGRREWVHAFVMLALAFLLLFSLWLPIASVIPVHTGDWGNTYQPTLDFLAENPASVATLAIAPPFAIAAIYTALAIRTPRLVRALRIPIIVVLSIVCLTSLELRQDARQGAFAVHDNFTHLLLAAVMLAIVATVTLSLSTWLTGWLDLRRLARGGRPREFAVSDDDSDAVATMEITGWLRGPRMRTRSFIASDGHEELRVPAGAKLVTAVPKWSSVMRTGEQVVVVTKRDRLRLGGLVARHVGDSPFRSHEITDLGPELRVARAEPISTPVESMLLTAWRPSVAYLIILVVAAAPSLLGLFVNPRH
jgi:hypothetical protein